MLLSPNHPHFKYAFSIDCNKANGMKMFFRQNCNYKAWCVCSTKSPFFFCSHFARWHALLDHLLPVGVVVEAYQQLHHYF